MDDKKTTSIGNKVPWIFFMNIFTQTFGIQVTLQFMNMFMTNYAMISPLTVASILTVGRLVDLGVSMVAGGIVQKANLKTGPFRTWIVINGPLLAIGNFLIFWNPDVGQTAKIVIFIIGYFFRNIPQNFIMSAQNALIGKVAGSDMDARLAITARNIQGTQASAIVTSALTVPLTTYFNNAIGNGRGYLIVAMLYCAFQTVGQIIVYKALSPYDQYDPNLKNVQGSSANVKVTHMYGDTLKNPQIWILMTAGILAQIAMFTLSPLNAYFFTYALGDINLMAVSTTTASFLGLLIAFAAPPIAKKMGKKNSAIVSYFGSLIGYIGMAMFSHGNFVMYMVFTIFNRIIMGPVGSIGVNLWLDAAEYQLYKTGRDSRPFIMSLNSMTMKIGQMISSFTYVWVLNYCNFDNSVPGAVTLDSLKLTRGLFSFLGICYGIMGLLYCAFGINEAKAKEYAEHNQKMLAERAAGTSK